ncbi:hypothetical protein BH23CHL2_BH23CHL2_36170 [soil metagenome]
MARRLSRSTLAVVISLLVLLVAGNQTFAGAFGEAPDDFADAIHHLPSVEDRTLRSQQPGYEILNGDERSLQIIIGSDDRQQVTDTMTFPNSAITYIEVWNDDKDYVYLCTAAFIGPNVLLTAAHCLWIPDFGGYPDGVAVAPGMNGDSQPFGIDFASEIWVPDAWINANGNINEAYEADYGLIVLDNSELGNQVGAFAVDVPGTGELEALDFQPSTAGYPGDKPSGTQWSGSSNAFKSVQSNLLVHGIDAFQGQSGSPVWGGSDQAIVGVISFETSQDNYARRITDEVMGDLNGARSAMGCEINQAGAGAPTTNAQSPLPQLVDQAGGDLSAFDRVYARTDVPVEAGLVSRTWMWGPVFSGVRVEPYGDGQRAVIYHEKSRMEISHPEGDPGSIWYVTNGLIARELVTGRMQLGDSRFEELAPAEINVAGDVDDPNGPVYASFLGLLDATPFESGSTITATIDRAGNVGIDPSMASEGVTAAHYAPETNHTVASVFREFMNASGVVNDGGYREDLLFQNPYFATGLPITEPYWASVRVGGTERTVLVQVFERRVLTYTPGNPPGWAVEAGNVGLHYYAWRYDRTDSAP